jgi:hypothetical protein
MRVEVYRNLHNGMWSVRDCKTGLVVDHVHEIAIADPVFVVQPAGRRKVIQQQRKNVHAFVRGQRVERPIINDHGMLDCGTLQVYVDGVPVTYNPYKYDSFVNKTDETPIRTAGAAVLTTSGVTAYTIGR